MLNTIIRLTAASIFLGCSFLIIALSVWTSRRPSRMYKAIPPVLAAAFIVLSVAMVAQQSGDTHPNLPDSSIEGIVTVEGPIETSRALEGTKLTLTEGRFYEKSRSVFTDVEGHYQFDCLSAGTYQLNVKVKGYQPYTATVHLWQGEMHLENVALHAVNLARFGQRGLSFAKQGSAVTLHMRPASFDPTMAPSQSAHSGVGLGGSSRNFALRPARVIIVQPVPTKPLSIRVPTTRTSDSPYFPGSKPLKRICAACRACSGGMPSILPEFPVLRFQEV